MLTEAYKQRKKDGKMVRYFERNRFGALKVAGISHDQSRKRALILGLPHDRAGSTPN